MKEINREAARIAREEADRMTRLTPEKPRFVAASIGPTNQTLSMSPDVENPAYRALTFDEVVVRAGDTHERDMHLDTDEANAAGLSNGQLGEIIK